MGKKSRRKAGARRYADYSEETLKLAVDLVKSKSLSSYEAEKQFGIPRRTILNHCKNKHEKAVGRPNELTVEDESHIADVVELAGKFGCPLSMLDLRLVVYNYIQKSGRNYLFNGKLPGERWARSFLERHQFSMRAMQNIKRNRAAKTIEEMSTYFDHLKESIKDVPGQNILNFDETNLSDDPGSSKAAFKRGTKHPERVLNSSKTAVSIMFSVTGDGKCLPPYVVYKAEHLWSQWCRDGPPNTRYNRTKSGWFDMVCFDDWFKTIVLPWANSLEGPKVVIGDNLSSHLSVEVVQLCKENNINLVFLPPNSTHMTQPLDVAFFAPMKKVWRKILLDHKVKNTNKNKPNVTTLNKTHFPQLLRQLMTNIHMSSTQTICSGFAACGIFPFNPSRVLGKIPVVSADEAKQFDAALLEYLEKNRKPQTQIKTTKNKKMTVVAGKSVSTEDVSKFVKVKEKSTVKRKKNKDINKENAQTLQQPNTLKVICTQFVNKSLFGESISQTIKSRSQTAKKKQLKSCVRLLGQVSHHDKENTAFTATNDHDLPICLQRTDTMNSDNCRVKKISTAKPKIELLTDKIVTPGPSGASESVRSKGPKDQYTRLKTIQNKVFVGLDALSTKITPGNKVKKTHPIIPSPTVRKHIKKENKKIKTGQKYKKKRASRYSMSSTSLSDEISVHSDSSTMDISDEIDSLSAEKSNDLPLSCFTNSRSPSTSQHENENDEPCLKHEDALISSEKSDDLPLCCFTNTRSPSTSQHENENDEPCLKHDDALISSEKSDYLQLRSFTNSESPSTSQHKNENDEPCLKHDDALISSEKSDDLPLSCLTNSGPPSKSQHKNETDELCLKHDALISSESDSYIKTNDTVVVRYYSRNTWKYYIGLVTAHNNDDSFDISFYTTMRVKGELKFKKPRRLDRDTVPRDLIMKVVELSKISDKPEVYHLHNQIDEIYF